MLNDAYKVLGDDDYYVCPMGQHMTHVKDGLVALAHNLRKYAKHLSNIKPETTPPEATAMALCADCLPDCAA